MESIGDINLTLLLSALLVLSGVFSSLIARRFGAPLLLVFLAIGMLAGEDGLGGFRFDDYRGTYLLGSLALAIILFDGGLRTRLSTLRPVLGPAVSLASIGVAISAAVTAVFAWLAMELSPAEALLVGAIVASTDAAAVFFLLRAGGLRLRSRVGNTLEVESGTNDPAAFLLSVVLIEWLMAQDRASGWAIFGLLIQQITLGAAFGALGGWLCSQAINRVELPSGLHPLLVIASAIAVFALTSLSGGSGLLAVYLAGLVLGNRPLRAQAAILSFHDAATWLAQILMFVVLGMLVTPSTLIGYAGPSLLVAAGLMLVARPIAVWLCLWPFGFNWREKTFISWVGLRGAVAIFLAAIPVLAHMPKAELYFNVAFFVVVLSLLVQAWTIGPAARWLRQDLPGAPPLIRRAELDLPGQLELEMVGYPVHAESPVLRHAAFPDWARLVLVVRDAEVLRPQEAGSLQAGDYAYFLAPPWRAYVLDRFFAHRDGDDIGAPATLGEFSFSGEAPLADVAALYGLKFPRDKGGMTLSEFFRDSYGDAPQPGDRLALGGGALVVRRVFDNGDCQIGLKLDSMRLFPGSKAAANTTASRVRRLLRMRGKRPGD